MSLLLRRFSSKSNIPHCRDLLNGNPIRDYASRRHLSAGEIKTQCHSGLTLSVLSTQYPLHSHCSTKCLYEHDTLTKFSFLQDEFQKWHNGGGMFHKSACVDPTALIEVGATVHSKSLVGEKVHIGSGSVIGPEVTIGQSTKIGYNVALSNCSIGDSCVIHHGASIGQDGFGFFINEQGNMVKKPQPLNLFLTLPIEDASHHILYPVGPKNLKVRIGNNVEIGANSCIDRGSWRDTVIGDHSKIDNLVQIGHNVVIGKNCMLCGQVGVAGSVTMGEFVTLGGRVGVRDHVSIVSKVRLAANSCVTKDINEPGDYGGFPAVPIHEWRRQVASRSRRNSA